MRTAFKFKRGTSLRKQLEVLQKENEGLKRDLETLKEECITLQTYVEYVGYNMCVRCNAYVFPGHRCHVCGSEKAYDEEGDLA